MKSSYLLWSVALLVLFEIPASIQECLIQSMRGVPSYVCHSLEDLEAKENPFAYNVVVYNNKTLPSPKSTPNVKVVMTEDIDNGMSPNTMKLLKEFSRIFQNNREINKLPAEILANLPIQELIFQDNGINLIEKGALSNLPNVRIIEVSNNKLSTVTSGVFNGSPVETLNLSHNMISLIEKEAFKNMINLKNLYLDFNRLSEFEPELIMNYPQKLQVLWLRYNWLNEIDRNTVRGLDNLRELRLNNNKITQISRYTFENLKKLEVLVLSYNRIMHMNAEIFPNSGMPRLEKLHFNDNRLSYLTTNVLERLRNLKSIRIGGNPWQCPCFDAILAWLSDHNVQQVCDRDYYSGTRPVCVVHDTHPFICDYSTDNFYYQRYAEVNSKAPKSPACDL